MGLTMVELSQMGKPMTTVRGKRLKKRASGESATQTNTVGTRRQSRKVASLGRAGVLMAGGEQEFREWLSSTLNSVGS
jgi:hypothetical protein